MRIYFNSDTETAYTGIGSYVTSEGETLQDAFQKAEQEPKYSFEQFTYYTTLFIILFALIIAFFNARKKK